VTIVLKTINFFVSSENFQVLINAYEPYLKAKKRSRKYSKIFHSFELVSYKDQYLSLHPMPSKEFLNKYYEDTYWENRADQNRLVRIRDIQHFNLITRHFSDFNSNKKIILNFGAGHGGISILFRAGDHTVYNFEYSNLNLFENNFYCVNDFDQIEGSIKFDLIYASHSLEHVHSINETFYSFLEHAHLNTIYFFEVPNCKKYLKKPQIDPPHTYYFNKRFFESIFADTKEDSRFFLCNDISSGNVLRVLTNRCPILASKI